MDKSIDILRRAVNEHEPEHIYCLYSGGNDSLVSTHFARQILPEATVLHIDTGIGFPEVRRHVVETCRRFEWPLRIIDHSQHRGETYEQWTEENGMPGPTGHSFVYQHLKERAIEQIVRETKSGWWDRVLFVTGVYQGESERRARIHTEEIKRKGARVMANPVLYWSDNQLSAYRRNHDLPQNPVTEIYGGSGECLCGAFAQQGEMRRIEYVNEDVADRLRTLEKKAKGPWGYEDKGPTGTHKREQEGQLALPLCTDCKL